MDFRCLKRKEKQNDTLSIPHTERDDDWHILGVQVVKVDGESIKPDTWYELRVGKVVEAKKED